MASLPWLEGVMHRSGFQAIENHLKREREPYLAIAVRPLSPMIGAEVEGVDLRAKLSDQEVAELRRAFLEHHVLVFRDHAISEAQHYDIAGLLGFAPEPGRRSVTTPSDEERDVPEPIMMTSAWGAHETWRREPPAGGLLHVHKLPRTGVGGDMLFSNMHMAYDLLSEPLRALLAELTAIHAPAPGGDGPAGEIAEHPVVVRHPLTGRATLFVNRAHTSHIVQLEPGHSDSTLEMLYRHVETHPVLTCRIRWSADALVAWDNCSAQHMTLQDFTPRCLRGHMVSLAGNRPEAWVG